MTDTTVETPKTREEILAMSLEARVAEVMNYQINIDNYAIALEEITVPSQTLYLIIPFTSSILLVK